MIGELSDLKEHPPWRPEQIRVPVLCLCGEHGRPHHQRGTVELTAMLPDARSAIVDGAHHFGPNTHPDAVAALVRDFVGGLSRRSSSRS